MVVVRQYRLRLQKVEVHHLVLEVHQQVDLVVRWVELQVAAEEVDHHRQLEVVQAELRVEWPYRRRCHRRLREA